MLCVCVCVEGGVDWWGLIRMWVVPREKQDLNKAGMNAQFCLAAQPFLLHPQPIPAQAVPGAGRRGHSYLWQVL